jgi:hypothetical protein
LVHPLELRCGKHYEAIDSLSVYKPCTHRARLTINSSLLGMSLSSSPILRTSHTSTIDGHQEYDKEKGHKLEHNELPFLPESGYEVRFEPEDDPQQLSLFRRWMAVATISSAALCVTCASSMASISTLITALSICYSTHLLRLPLPSTPCHDSSMSEVK